MSDAIRPTAPARGIGVRFAGGIRPWRWLLAVVGLLVLLVGIVYLGGGWYISGMIGDRLEVSARLEDWNTHNYALLVESMGNTTGGTGQLITLRVPAGSSEAVTEGVWGVRAPDGGFGQIGRITASGEGRVTREFRQLTAPAIHVGEELELVNDSFPEDPMAALGIPYENVSYSGPLGQYPAWYIAGTQPDWAILVHGDSMHRQDTLEPMAPIYRAGLPMLVITYRNDPGVPSPADGLLREGATEWADLQGAVTYALDHGAHNVILVGRSMGGGVVLSFLERSQLAKRVKAVILDAPMSSFSKAIDAYAASQVRLPLGLPVPDSLLATGKWIVGWRYGFDWAAADYLAGDTKLAAPILLFHGGSDTLIAKSLSDQLAADRPDIVTYIVTPGAGHLDSWNLDPARYEANVEAFASAHAAE